MKNIFFVFVSVLLLFYGCKPQEEDAIELGPVPSNVDFTIEEKAGEINTFILTNQTTGAFQYSWDNGNGVFFTGEQIEVYYPLKGDYEVILRAFNDGGFGSSTKTITVLEDDLAPCPSNSFTEFLTGCDELTWVLEPVAGAYWVGPDDATTWWASPEDAVNTRFCAFDDEWTFSPNGEMIYDTKGDLWAEDYMGHDFVCVTDDQLVGGAEIWRSGDFTFEVVEADIPQLTVIGLGAFMGLPKPSNDGELSVGNPTPSYTQITYDIIEMNEDANGKSMTIEVNFGPGLWRFRYVTK